MNSKLRTALILLVLFLATWIPRVVALDKFVTIDERKWLARSANFYQAWAQGDFASTFQREHPGVTVMYAGTLGWMTRFPEFLQQAPGYFGTTTQEVEAWLKASTAHTPIEMLAAGRWWIVLGVALLLTLSFLPLRRLIGEPLAALAVLFIAWMPWAVALSRQLHPDGFVSSMIFVSLVFFLAWLYAGRHRSDLILSGVFMGLGWLTKTPAAFLVPIGLVLIAAEWWRTRRSEPQGWKPLLIGYVVWGIVASAIFFLLWPATWVNPIGTFAQMTQEMEEYMAGHVNPNFFMGQPTGDPGWFFYPVAYLFRVTPATVIGLLAAAVAAVRKAGPFSQPQVRRAAFGFFVFGLLFMLLMTLPAKKFDRYLLPAFPAFEVVAALGWGALAWWAGDWWARRRARKTGANAETVTAGQRTAPYWAAALVVLFVGLVPLHSLLTALHYPYYLTYFNPLVGGSLTAPKVMIIGWGEGLDEAAAWLNQQPNAEKLKIVSWYFDGPTSYFTKAEPTGLNYESSLAWLDNDFVVTYINQFQREIPSPQAVQWYLNEEPAYKFSFGGLDLVRVYDMRNKPLPDFLGLNVASAADFGGKIRLVAHELDLTEVDPGEEIFAQFFLRSQAPIDTNYNILVRLVDAQGKELWREEGWPWGAATKDWPLDQVRPDGRYVRIPADTPAGIYKLVVSFYDPATLENLPATSVVDGSLIDPNVRDVALITVGVPEKAANQLDEPWVFGEHIALTGVDLPAAAAPGSDVPVTLQWTSRAATPTDYTVFVHVVDENGEVVAQKDQPPLGGFAPTHIWSAGQRVLDHVDVPLKADLPPGQYTVRMGLYNAAGRLPVMRGDEAVGDFAVVGEFEVK